MEYHRIAEIQPDVIVADSVAYWGKLTAMKHGIPYISSTTTFAFSIINRVRVIDKYYPLTTALVAKMTD